MSDTQRVSLSQLKRCCVKRSYLDLQETLTFEYHFSPNIFKKTSDQIRCFMMKNKQKVFVCFVFAAYPLFCSS